jgi:membrane protease YdiL (CAAX protease family)
MIDASQGSDSLLRPNTAFQMTALAARKMNNQSEIRSTAPTLWHRVLRFPIVQIVVAVLFIAIPFAVVSTPFNLFVTDKPLRRVGALLLAAVVLAAYSAYVRVMEKRAVAELSGRGAVSELSVGVALGALLFSATVGILAALGVYQVTGNNGWLTMLAILPACILSGVLEEVLIRGIVFRILEQWLGSWLALGISAVIFGVLHLLNPGATLLNAAAISIEAGVLLAAAYMLTRRLWLCIGTHIAWNFTQGGVFSVAVSGGASKGLLQSRMVGPDWLTGGAFGAEASVVALVICLAAGVVLLVMAIRKGNIVPASRGNGTARELKPESAA